MTAQRGDEALVQCSYMAAAYPMDDLRRALDGDR
jgi:hypothetical protein